MKAVMLAGGLHIGTPRRRTPSPMSEISGKPILWHIMKFYSTHGINDFDVRVVGEFDPPVLVGVPSVVPGP